MPETRLGVLVPGEAGDANDGDDQAVPIWVEAPSGDVEGLDLAMLLPSMSVLVDGLGTLGWRALGTNRLDGVVEGRLVGLDLGNKETPDVLGSFKCFFDSGSRLR